MTMLRLKLQIINGVVTPTVYELYNTELTSNFLGEQKKLYYQIADVRDTLGSYDHCTLYCHCKLDWSSMNDGEIKTVHNAHGEATLTAVSGMSTAKAITDVIGLGWKKHKLLSSVYKNSVEEKFESTKEGERCVLPQYLIAKSVQQIKDNVHFYFHWGDKTVDYTAVTYLVNKGVDLTIQLFE